MKKIYLAAPYSHPDQEIIASRVKYVNKIAARLMKTAIVYSPISHCHAIAIENELPTDAAFWENQNKAFIKWCDQLVVLKLLGWEQSIGVKQEIAWAREFKKEIIMVPNQSLWV